MQKNVYKIQIYVFCSLIAPTHLTIYIKHTGPHTLFKLHKNGNKKRNLHHKYPLFSLLVSIFAHILCQILVCLINNMYICPNHIIKNLKTNYQEEHT